MHFPDVGFDVFIRKSTLCAISLIVHIFNEQQASVSPSLDYWFLQFVCNPQEPV